MDIYSIFHFVDYLYGHKRWIAIEPATCIPSSFTYFYMQDTYLALAFLYFQALQITDSRLVSSSIISFGIITMACSSSLLNGRRTLLYSKYTKHRFRLDNLLTL